MKKLDELRKKYKNTKLGLYNMNHQMVTNVYGAYNLEKTMNTNESWEISFKISSLQDEISQNSCQMLVKIMSDDEPDFFIIKEVTINTDDVTILDVKGYREEESLKAVFCEVMNEVGKTAEELFNSIKSHCKNVQLDYFWGGTDADLTQIRSIVGSDESSVWDNLILLAQAYDGWLEFSIDQTNFNKYVFLRTIPTDKGMFIRNGLNYKPLSINFSTKNLITRMYAYGSKDVTTGEDINIIGVNPTGKAYVQNTEYYEKVLGMSLDNILNNPSCMQEGTFRDSNIGDANVLLNTVKEELAKKSQPEISGTVTYQDINIFETGYPNGEMDIRVGEKIRIVNTDVGYTFSTIVQSITKKYSTDIMQTPLTITNVIPYADPLKELINTGITVNKVTSIDTTSGQPYISTATVKDENTGLNIASALASKVDATEIASLIEEHPSSVLNAINNTANATDVNLSASNGLTVNKGKARVFNSSGTKVFWINESGQVSISDNMQIYSNGVLVADIGYSNGVLTIENKNGDLNLVGTNIKINGTNLNDVIDQRITEMKTLDGGTFLIV
ncbi:hypothetical protein GKZ28_13200 [Clostridium chromiireducens]|uniref:Tail spike domain-containing protein n=1 Tax=Clostridium chromiireducens TaxID=225345 RepID=A0A964RND6_9CLOT|nr:phage tail protein [Clostridium chromiireducens]MVX64650.1 hypothetical protein [Clostridium chromiireducens]